MSLEQKDVSGFLRELTALSIKYGIEIGGCGCCGSPFLVEITGPCEKRYAVNRKLEELSLIESIGDAK